MHPHYHFIGIGGIGMSALAHILIQRGIRVSGSDISPSYVTNQLQAQGAEVFFSHASENVPPGCAVVYNSQISGSNPEVERARELGLPFLHRSELLRDLMEGSQPLLVAGTHGKTTTSSLLSHVLAAAGIAPSFAIGGIVKSLGSNGGFGTGKYFVAEADESDGSFLKYHAFGAILTNIDKDHLDYWKNVEALIAGFQEFAARIESSDHFFWCGDDTTLRALQLSGHSYGFSETNQLYIENFRQEGWLNVFDFSFEGKRYAEVELPLVGAHSVLNAAAVFGLALKMQIPEECIRQGLATFQGVARRADFKGECKGICAYDDYAHHPTEIFATLRAVKQAVKERRLVAAFQPHRYSRTRDCLNEFGPAFERADVLILTDIYAAGEAPIEGVTSQSVVDVVKENYGKELHYLPRAELEGFLAQFLKPSDVLLTLGAGDITKVGKEVLRQLHDQEKI